MRGEEKPYEMPVAEHDQEEEMEIPSSGHVSATAGDFTSPIGKSNF